ncbi:MAG: hypothetical protein LBQ59_02085 [Candidatus Peribacteria bacterium]|nr:hypothetical protein [Candidatus Peribacteria bacterium]
MENFSLNSDKFQAYFINNLQKYSDKEYLYWDKIKFKDVPNEFKNIHELWSFIKFMRQSQQIYQSPIKTEN